MHGLRYSPLRLGALYLERNHMRALGVDRTSRIARSRNRRRRQHHLAYRQRLERHLPERHRERQGAGPANGRIEMEDGWARDESRSLLRRFVAPAGTVLFLDSGRCFHFGSRKPANPRYQLQYAYVSPIRNDFSDLIRPQVSFPVRSDDPMSRRLALDRELKGE